MYGINTPVDLHDDDIFHYELSRSAETPEETIAKNMNVVRDNHGQTLLIYLAADEKNELAMEKYLEHSADPNSVDKEGNTALMVAASHGHLDVVETLIPFILSSYDGNLDAKNNLGKTTKLGVNNNNLVGGGEPRMGKQHNGAHFVGRVP